MNETKPLISTIRSVVVSVANLNRARRIYEDGFGLKCLSEIDEISDEIRKFWNLDNAKLRAAQFGKPGEQFGTLELIEISGGDSSVRLRDAIRAFDYGVLSLNFRTVDIEKALIHLKKFDIKPISEILTYEAGGKKINEVMAILPTGERVTILQVGEKQNGSILFGEPVATVGTIVDSLETAKHFYCGLLGLSPAVKIAHTGEPFTTLLGIESNASMKMAMLTANGNWTGKFEFIELNVPNEKPNDTNLLIDNIHTGYRAFSVFCDDLDKLIEHFEDSNFLVEGKPVSFVHPFVGATRALMINSPGLGRLEILERNTTS